MLVSVHGLYYFQHTRRRHHHDGIDFTDRLAVISEHSGCAAVSREEAITAIRSALKRRSGKTWSIRGGRGTAWGWLTITAPPKRCNESGYMTDEDCAELGKLLGKDGVSTLMARSKS